jgi:AhpD family alkylhydroperoxidase
MMPQLRSLPAQPVMRDIYRAYPATCKPLGEFTEAAMRGPSPFAQGQRELIAAYVSGLNACTYCHGTHLAVAAACGVAPEVIKALLIKPASRSAYGIRGRLLDRASYGA